MNIFIGTFRLSRSKFFSPKNSQP